MTRLLVEVAFGYSVTDPAPVWTDVTEFVDIGTGVTINHGSSDELSQVQAGTCSMTLDNSDGRFTSGRAGSPYYPNVKKNVPIRVRVISAGKNWISNPSFETGLDGWQKTFSPTIVQDNAHVQSGSQAMRVTWGGSSGQAVWIDATGLDIGQTYTASAWVWVQSAAGTLFSYIQGVGGTSAPNTVFGDWQRLTFTFTATATQHLYTIQTSGTPTAGSQAWIDAVQLEEGSTATTFDPTPPQTHDRFWGMVNDWPLKWSGLYATASITCTDIFKWLARQPALSPMLIEEMMLDSPTVLFPLSEPSDSTSAGDLSGTPGVGTLAVTQAGTGGTLTFGDGTGPAGASAPTFTPASVNAGKYLTADLGQEFLNANALRRLRLDCWFSTTTTGRILLAVATVDASSRVIISLESGTGLLKIESAGAGGPLIAAAVDPTPNLADGAVHYLMYHELEGVAYVDGTAYNVTNAAFMPGMRMLSLGGYVGAQMWSGSISNLGIYLTTATSADLIPHYITGSTQHVGESAAARMARIASYLPLTVTTSGSVFDGMASQAALGRTPLEHLQEIADTESGRLLASRSGNGLIFQSRDVRYNPVASVSLDFADLDTDEVEMSDDDQKMVNTVIASRPGGATQRVLDQTARDTYGPYEEQLDLLKSSDLKVADAANWMVSRYADPPLELRQVPVEASTMPLATYRALLAADVSTTFDVTNLPTGQAPVPTLTVTVEGYAETIQENQHHLDFHTSRGLTDTVWALDSASYSQLGATTRLAY
ncbi:phage head spike fiber domain-containing protein [Streptomyces violaceusniger]|uniref:Carbohydrate-binding CenC domain protein n=1 Tax=Streptomyces violaceusniger (strain Tu 4113) TaxID=653045 RepID=G2P7D2_STRV4|nr:carbohydrate binding domain-containing protein [Streptomyces violaceusniger]AEM87092.1 Carbohydrate-binding CenC domain protein [Streptomyces violaceusniger Tu 4113]